MGSKLQIGVLALAWGLIAVAQGVVTFFVDDRFQAYRGWEYALVGTRSSRAPFCAHVVWDAPSYGDLSHMAGAPQLRRYRQQRFTTDEYGYRNPVGTLDRPCDVVVVGDSAAVGSQSSDDETLAGLIRCEQGLAVYNASGVNVSWFLADRRFEARPPRLVVVVAAERNLGAEEHFSTDEPAPFRPRRWAPSDVVRTPPLARMTSPAEVVAALDSGRALRPVAEPLLKGLLYALRLFDLPSGISHRDRSTGALFLAEAVTRHLQPERVRADVDRAVEVLRRFDRECRAKGTGLLVVVIPEKETVYADLVPALAGVDVGFGLRRLQSALDGAGVDNVDLLPLFAEHRRLDPDELLYYPDDTHLNPLGHRLVLEAVRGRLPDRAGAASLPRS